MYGMNENLIRNLVDIGLNRYEASVYLALIERADYPPSGLAQRAGIPRQRIYDILGSLEEKGFCTLKSTRPRSYTAVDPKLALTHLLNDRDRDAQEEHVRVEGLVEGAITTLAPVYESGSQESNPFHYLEVLRTSQKIAQRALAVAKETRSSVNSFVKLPLILSSEQNIRFIQEPLSRGIRDRSIYEAAALEEPKTREFARACYDMGQEIRVSERLPVKMHAFDGKTALLSLQDPVGGRPSFTAIVTHHVGMVEALNIAFETLWGTAEGAPFSQRRDG
jgi:HTH-type transcriptional regulator, sugar sensing transcriptional regulator